MAIGKSSVLRMVCAGALAAAIIIAPVVGVSAGLGSDSRTVAAPCTQVNTNGSVSLQCGGAPPNVGNSGSFSNSCVNAFGTYQNCMSQEGPRH
jgi:hypothetical protein